MIVEKSQYYLTQKNLSRMIDKCIKHSDYIAHIFYSTSKDNVSEIINNIKNDLANRGYNNFQVLRCPSIGWGETYRVYFRNTEHHQLCSQISLSTEKYLHPNHKGWLTYEVLFDKNIIDNKLNTDKILETIDVHTRNYDKVHFSIL